MLFNVIVTWSATHLMLSISKAKVDLKLLFLCMFECCLITNKSMLSNLLSYFANNAS